MMPAAVTSLGSCTGVVASFDDPRGLGTVIADHGGIYSFHCANIADGSRRIAVGVPVAWTVAPGRLGQWEAVDIRPIAGRAG
jgi:cold shock CspA family protein